MTIALDQNDEEEKKEEIKDPKKSSRDQTGSAFSLDHPE